MNVNFIYILWLFVPFLGTFLGVVPTLFIKEANNRLLNITFGFSAGVMLAASVWSLIIPSIELNCFNPKFLVPTIGYVSGVMLMLIIDKFTHSKKEESNYKNMLFAVNVHNFPEGMCVGVSLSAFLKGSVSFSGFSALAIGIAIQNVPEGFIVSMPLISQGKGKKKAIISGAISGLFELIGGFCALIITTVVSKILPFTLAFSAGAMQWVVYSELLPQAQTKLSQICCVFGFLIMMVLDVALG